MFNLNSNQQEAAETFIDSLFDPNIKYIHIKGRAGTGKSHLISNLISDGYTHYKDTHKLMGIPILYRNIFLSATTNKAASVLTEQHPYNNKIGTVHSLFGLKVVEDYVTGKTRVSRTPSSYVLENSIIFVDEAWMIDSTLMRHIEELTTKTCKVVFVGDPYQLGPVGEPRSAVEKYCDLEINLSTPVRNANSKPLMDLCDQLVETVETGVFKPIKSVPGIIDILDNNEAEHTINRILKVPDEDVKILSYTNNKVKDYNQYLRSIRNLSDKFKVGEYVFNNSSTTSTNPKKANMYTDQKLLVTGANRDLTSESFNNLIIPYQYLTLNSHGMNYFVKHIIDHNFSKEVLKYFSKQKNWSDYYSFKNEFPDIRMGDSRTTFKAQGSTYREVFIDLEDLGTCTSKDQLARMLYVAVSRAKERVYLYGKLPARIFN